jgi:DNA polymerase
MKVDLDLAQYAASYASTEKEELGNKLAELTGGVVTKVTQAARLVSFLKEEFEGGVVPHKRSRELMTAITRINKEGKVKYSADKMARAALLANPNLAPVTREIVEAYDQGSNSSVSKFSAMLLRADPVTARVHGAFIFAGAGQTSRYSSKGLQVHNFRRDVWSADEAEALKRIMEVGGDIAVFSGMTVMDTLAKLLRPAIIPEEGHSFVVSDWSAIEARVLPWLSDSVGGEKILDIFRDGRDIYVETANDMAMDDRQTGKVAVLSLGFGGAVGALQAMCKNYGVIMSDAEAQTVVDRWREANVWAINFWNALEAATIRAVRAPNRVQKVGRLRYIFAPKLLGGTLLCILPDDSVIQYPYARLEKGGVTCMKASVKPAADSTEEWPRMRLWGGFLAENVTQSTAAALLKDALRECYSADLPVTGHVHDEIIVEVPDTEVELATARLQNIMESCPMWAEGLPLTAAPAIMKRYGK